MKRTVIVVLALMFALIPCAVFADVTITVNDNGEATTYDEEEYYDMLIGSGDFIKAEDAVSADEYYDLARDYEQLEEHYEAETDSSNSAWGFLIALGLIVGAFFAGRSFGRFKG